MSNYILYPVVELKGYIIVSVILLFLCTLMALFFLGRNRRGLEAYRWQSLFFGRSRREIACMALGISQVAFILSSICFFVPMGTVQIAALAVLCVGKGLLGLSPSGMIGEICFGVLTGTALMAGNLLMDYMTETGVDLYILAIWVLLALFVLQYGIYFFIKGLERMLQQHERARDRKKQKQEAKEGK